MRILTLSLTLTLCLMVMSCRIRTEPVPSTRSNVIQIDLEPGHKVSGIQITDGEIQIETRHAYTDEQAEQIFYNTYNRNSGALRQRFIVTEHPGMQ